MTCSSEQRELHEWQRGRGRYSGSTIVTFAIVLPILIMLLLGTLQLFVYFRTASAVERAAAEAARTFAVSEPTAGAAHRIEGVAGKSVVSSSHGGASGALQQAFARHGRFYEPAGGRSPGAHHPPFRLSPTQNGPQPERKDPGVQLLPWVTSWTCTAPASEQVYSDTVCGPKDDLQRHAGFVSYQLPGLLDFDGDSHEDLSFFYPSTTADDWWVLPSSGGTLFRFSLRYDLGSSDASPAFRRPSLPCPADYDGDNRTDFCALVFPAGSTELHLRLSGELYEQLHSIRLSSIGAYNALPVPGRWTKGARDSFAVIITGSDSTSSYLSTWIWPDLQTFGSYGDTNRRTVFRDTPRKFTDSRYKPAPGRYWRPAFGDHDGNGLLDIGWLSWSAANPALTAVASGSADLPQEYSGVSADNNFEPWQLHYPSDGSSPGLYIVEQRSHRITLAAHGSDGSLNGEGRESFIVIAGSFSEALDELPLPSPDPLAKGIGSVASTPRGGESTCGSCFPGGAYSGEGTIAVRAELNSPRGLAGGGSSPLYIADYGNSRVRAVSTGADGIVNGAGNEVITTIAGGTVPFNVTCPSLADGRAGPAVGETARKWQEYNDLAREQGIHPRCVAVEPLSLAYSVKDTTLFIGDAEAVVFAVSPGVDNEINSDPDERLSIFAGEYSTTASSSPAQEQRLGRMYDLHWIEQENSPPGLFAALRGTDAAGIGGIAAIVPGASGIAFSSSGAIQKGRIVNVSGEWQPSASARGARLSASSTSLTNPTAVTAFRDSSGLLQILSSEWWNDTEGSSFENSLRHFYPTESGSGFDSYRSRWLTNSHLHAWGSRAPSSTSENWRQRADKRTPLAALPLDALGGLAVSPDLRYAYVSQTRLGSIIRIELDQDADGLFDFSSSAGLRDSDIDGDRINNEDDYDPFDRLYTQSETALFEGRSSTAFLDPVLWAVPASGQIAAGAALVDRIEWWLDRFAEYGRIPDSDTGAIPAGETPPFRLLNEQTVAALLARGALNDSPIWPGGVHRSTEYHPQTRRARLAPVILSSLFPSADEFKHVSGYDHCTDWSADPFSPANGVSSNGSPSTECGGSLSSSGRGPRIGIRRSHPAQWSNQWHPFHTPDKDNPLIGFIDWDGDGIRNPVVYRTDLVPASGVRPLSVHIGRLSGHSSSFGTADACPGSFALKDLGQLMPVLRNHFSRSLLPLEEQFQCGSSIRFFGSIPRSYATLMVDAHAEWEVRSHFNRVDVPAQQSDRMNTGEAGTGPVAETAYRVLEHMLNVERRDHAERPHDALVVLESGSSPEEGTGSVTVSYVLPLNRFFANIYGSDTIVITRKARRRVHESEAE